MVKLSSLKWLMNEKNESVLCFIVKVNMASAVSSPFHHSPNTDQLCDITDSFQLYSIKSLPKHACCIIFSYSTGFTLKWNTLKPLHTTYFVWFWYTCLGFNERTILTAVLWGCKSILAFGDKKLWLCLKSISLNFWQYWLLSHILSNIFTQLSLSAYRISFGNTCLS